MKSQNGVGLIEVLVAVLLVGTSLLAMSSMQVRSLTQNNESLLRSQANLFAYDILERVRMASPMAPSPLVRPSQTQLDDEAELLLPQGAARLDCDDASRICTVTIQWVEFSRGEAREARADQQLSSFTYASQI